MGSGFSAQETTTEGNPRRNNEEEEEEEEEEEAQQEDTHLAHFFRVGVLTESSNDHLEQLLGCLRLLHQVCRRSTARTHAQSEQKQQEE